VADLEQAIAEKCVRFLNPQKSVVTLVEIQQIVKEMGPVEGPAATNDSTSDKSRSSARPADAARRLYRIRETGMIGGICSGLGAYLDVDPTIVRIVFVLVTLFTHGLLAVLYVILMFVIPVATTSEERAAAQGLPFTAQELVDQAKEKYSALHDKAVSKAWWKAKKKVQMTPPADAAWAPAPPASMPPRHVGYGTRLLIGIFIPVFAIIRAALGVVLVLGVVSLVNYRGVFGVRLPSEMPLWVGILALILAYQVIVTPFRILRHSWSSNYLPYGHVGAEVLGGIIWLGFLVFFLYLAYQNDPNFRDFLRRLPELNHYWMTREV
jgi:phage shock protein PspC (stress-responsive transcriptional regulator)